MREWIDEFAHDQLPLITWDSFDRAIVGVVERPDAPTAVLYDWSGMLEVLMEDGSLSQEDAEEYLQFNVTSSYVGEHTPLTLYRPHLDAHE